MGYRSDTAIVLPFEVYQKGLKWMEENKIPDKDNMLKWDGYAKLFPNGDVLLFYDYFKWYDSYEEISALEKFIDTLDEGEYKYVQMGEEFEDNTYRGDYEEQSVWISKYMDIEDLDKCIEYKPNDKYYIMINLSWEDNYRYTRLINSSN